MKNFLKILLALVLSAAFLFAFACTKGDNGTQNSGNNQSSSSSGGQTEPQDFWDISSVDVSHINPKARLIAFTFDDGPTAKTDALLSAFEDFNAKNTDFTAHATLFTVGSFITEENSAVLTRAVSMNLELGNHLHAHKPYNPFDRENNRRIKKDGRGVKNIRRQSRSPRSPYRRTCR